MRVLLVASRYPVPAWRGNQVRTAEWLAALAGHELTLVCPQSAREGRLGSHVRSLFDATSKPKRGLGPLSSLLSGRPLQEGLYDTRRARSLVAETVRQWRPDVVVVQMVRCGWAVELVREISPSTSVIFDAIDSMGLHFERAAARSFPPMSTVFAVESGRCRRREIELARDAEISVAVADRDLRSLQVGTDRGRVIPVAGREVTCSTELVSEPVVIVTGNLGYRPTVQGIRWFAERVWPAILTSVPQAKWLLVGARPAAAVRQLGDRPSIEVHADVPEMTPFVERARLAIAPMGSGSGVPMKVLEAMAAGLPVVARPWAADGLVEEAKGAVAVSADAGDWARTITSLLTDDRRAGELAAKGREAWRRFYHPDVIAQHIRDVVEDAASRSGSGEPCS
jgi:glycosyltransferase involved in cell wall biosynthesis